MTNAILFDVFIGFYLLLVGSLLVAALWMRHHDCPPTGVDELGVGRVPARPYPTEDGLPQGLTGHDFDLTPLKGFCASALEEYARQLEDAIERIRLRTPRPRGR